MQILLDSKFRIKAWKNLAWSCDRPAALELISSPRQSRYSCRRARQPENKNIFKQLVFRVDVLGKLYKIVLE